MRTLTDPTTSAEELSLDEQVLRAFRTWNDAHHALTPLRRDYDKAMQAHAEANGPEPSALRERLREAQTACDQLFFQLLRVAEARSRERYI